MQSQELYGDRTMMNHPLLRGLLAACLLLTCALAAPAAGAPAGAVLRDGVVVDAARSAAYVMHPRGGIQAIDLAKGAVLWRSTQGERPLALAGDLLIAQARPGEHGELRIVALDVRRRGSLSAEADLAMPAGIRAEVAETVDRTFRVTAAPSAQGFVIAWDSQAMPVLPGRTFDRDAGPRKAAAPGITANLSGTALFDPHAGRLMLLKSAGAREIAPLRPVLAASLSSPNAAEPRFASADGRHVLASRHAGDNAAAPYRWTISDAATGAVLGTLRSDVSMSPFTVAGARLIHVAEPASRRQGTKWIEQPLRLRAVDLTTGRELWSREIRDTSFRGPFPL